MVRNKNPKIPVDAVGTYTRSIGVDIDSVRHPVRVEYTACLIDSEDVNLTECVGCDGRDYYDEVQARIDDVNDMLRAELAEYADYVEAHR